jgi:hypothetical protein
MSRSLGVYFSAAILLIAVTIASCASDISYDPRPPGSPVKIFRQYQPECDYVKLGKVRDSDGDVLKNAARAMGGDALIIKEGGPGPSRKGGVTPDAEPIHSGKRSMRGTVILFTDPTCTD